MLVASKKIWGGYDDHTTTITSRDVASKKTIHYKLNWPSKELVLGKEP